MMTCDTRQPSRRKPLTIIGLGNELLTDDGVGIRVVRELKKRLQADDITFEELSIGGLQLLDYITGYDRCIIVDAVSTGTHPAGTTFRFVQTADSEPARITSSHQIDLSQVLTLGKLLGADIPQKVVVYGIEAHDWMTFQERCTDEVSRAIPKLVEAVCTDLQNGGTAFSDRAGQWNIINDPVPD